MCAKGLRDSLCAGNFCGEAGDGELTRASVEVFRNTVKVLRISKVLLLNTGPFLDNAVLRCLSVT